MGDAGLGLQYTRAGGRILEHRIRTIRTASTLNGIAVVEGGVV